MELRTWPMPSRIRVFRPRLNLSAASGALHRHPCDVVGYVASGSIVYQVEGRPSRVLKAGDAFHEPHNARIAFYLLGAGEDLIEMSRRGRITRPTPSPARCARFADRLRNRRPGA